MRNQSKCVRGLRLWKIVFNGNYRKVRKARRQKTDWKYNSKHFNIPISLLGNWLFICQQTTDNRYNVSDTSAHTQKTLKDG